jgi:hypothetical protein
VFLIINEEITLRVTPKEMVGVCLIIRTVNMLISVTKITAIPFMIIHQVAI